MKKFFWNHYCDITMEQEIQIPDDFEISHYAAKPGHLLLTSTDGRVLEFFSTKNWSDVKIHNLSVWEEDINGKFLRNLLEVSTPNLCGTSHFSYTSIVEAKKRAEEYHKLLSELEEESELS